MPDFNHPPIKSPSSKPILVYNPENPASFKELIDTFSSYTGYGQKFLIVRSDETGIAVYEEELHSDRNYLHIQEAANQTWTVNHNLGKYPSCEVMSETGHVINCDKQHTSINQTILNFGEPFSGIAIFN